MSKDLMNYKAMVEGALRDVVRVALARIADSGLPGNHHLYLTFRTRFAGVLMPEYLRQKHPEENDHRVAAPVLGAERPRRQLLDHTELQQ